MDSRYRTTAYPTPRPPSARRLMLAGLLAFTMFSLLLILAGRLPFVPTPIAIEGGTYREYEAQDRMLLSEYGYTAEGAVHLPIERAMELIVERGLPVRANPSSTP